MAEPLFRSAVLCEITRVLRRLSLSDRGGFWGDAAVRLWGTGGWRRAVAGGFCKQFAKGALQILLKGLLEEQRDSAGSLRRRRVARTG
jgi:hypothetical protein